MKKKEPKKQFTVRVYQSDLENIKLKHVSLQKFLDKKIKKLKPIK